MTDEKIKETVCKLFEFGEDKWFDYQDEFIAFARLIAKRQMEKDAEICNKLASNLEDDAWAFSAAILAQEE